MMLPRSFEQRPDVDSAGRSSAKSCISTLSWVLGRAAVLVLPLFLGHLSALAGDTASLSPPSMNAVDAPTSEPRAPEDLDARHAAAIAANPEGVTLVVRLAAEKTRFVADEPIVLSLEFASRGQETYELLTGIAPLRPESESIDIEPKDGVADPLTDYPPSTTDGFRGIAKLSIQPTTVPVVLNTLIRFDAPGKYRFFVRSSSIRPPGREAGVPPSIASNIVEIEIVHDPTWDAKELSRIRGVLANDRDSRIRAEARTALRFLQSSDAIATMVDDLCRVARESYEDKWQIHYGLFGARRRAEAINTLKEALLRPDCSVTTDHLWTLTYLELAGRKRSVEAWRAVQDPLLAALIGAIDEKSDDARAVSLYTVLRLLGERRGLLPSANQEALRVTLSKVIERLPEPVLVSLLDTEWPLARSPAMAAPLLAIVREARPRGSNLRSVSDVALARLVELDYPTARKFILAEIARPESGPRTSFSGSTLGLLKDRELPDLDAELTAGLKRPERDSISLELHGELFARYASKAVVKEAIAAYRSIPYFRISLLSYLARHDPWTADQEIRAITDLGSLERLSHFMWNGTLEAAVISHLDTQEVHQAAFLLAQRGTPGAEKALLGRLRALAGRDKVAASLILRALLQASSWIETPKKLRELAALCKDEECRRPIQDAELRWGEGGSRPQLVLWSTYTSSEVSGWIAHYDIRSIPDLKSRIQQLPAGTTLFLQTKPEEIDSALMAEVRKWAAARKVMIVSDG